MCVLMARNSQIYNIKVILTQRCHGMFAIARKQLFPPSCLTSHPLSTSTSLPPPPLPTDLSLLLRHHHLPGHRSRPASLPAANITNISCAIHRTCLLQQVITHTQTHARTDKQSCTGSYEAYTCIHINNDRLTHYQNIHIIYYTDTHC
jgi:hypothetical protein